MSEPVPCPSHIATEFLAWLWWTTTQQREEFNLPDGKIEVFVDDRISFDAPAGGGTKNVVSGSSAQTDSSAIAALRSGKSITAMRLVLRRDDREYQALIGEGLSIRNLRLPMASGGNAEDAAHEQLFLIDEFRFLWGELFRVFAEFRTGASWDGIVEDVKIWLAGPASVSN